MPDKKAIPKTIWFLWLQGLEKAPLVVTKCYDSWLRHNPGWNLVLLDENNYRDYVSIESGNFTRQAEAENIRINLLAKYGGVWADATCYCNKPLDNWLHDVMPEGFFAFDRPGPDRMISSWFLAACTDNYIMDALQRSFTDYAIQNPRVKYIGDSKWRFLEKRLLKYDQEVWFSTFVMKVLKAKPYFWLQYVFQKIYLTDLKFKKMWDATPKISADIPHSLQIAGLFNPLNDTIKAEIDNKVSPVYKLTWKFEPAQYKSGTIMEYLLNETM
jgi:hypothetical protein